VSVAPARWLTPWLLRFKVAAWLRSLPMGGASFKIPEDLTGEVRVAFIRECETLAGVHGADSSATCTRARCVVHE